MKKSLALSSLVVMLCLCVGTVMAGEQSKAWGKKVAFINAGPDDYYAQFGEVFAELAKEYNWSVTQINSEYMPEKEIANVQDMIAAGVDAIAVITVQMKAAGEACRIANEANVPIFFMLGKPDESQGGKPDGHVTDSYLLMGYLVGEWVAKSRPEAKEIYMMEGFLGQGTAEAQSAGFEKALKDIAGIPVKKMGSGEWQRTKAIGLMQDLIASGRSYDVVYGQNDEMTDGILQAMEENGVKGKIVVSSNAKEMSWDWLKEGKVMADSPNPPSLNADMAVQQIAANFEGRPYEKYIRIYNPVALTKDNVGIAIPWTVKDYMAARAAKKFPYSLEHYAGLMKKIEAEKPWLKPTE